MNDLPSLIYDKKQNSCTSQRAVSQTANQGAHADSGTVHSPPCERCFHDDASEVKLLSDWKHVLL